MIGNLSVLLALAEATMSFLSTVGPAAARRSRSIVRRTSNCRIALMGGVTASLTGTRAARRHLEVAGPNAASPGEVPSP